MMQTNVVLQNPQTIMKANWINTAILAVIAISTVIIAIFLGMIVFHQSNNPSHSKPISPEWEYSWKVIRDFDSTIPGIGGFEDYNKWIGEGWEPILKLDTKDRYLMRRPKPAQ